MPPECSDDTYLPNYNILYTHRAQFYQNNLHKVIYENTHTLTVAETGY